MAASMLGFLLRTVRQVRTAPQFPPLLLPPDAQSRGSPTTLPPVAPDADSSQGFSLRTLLSSGLIRGRPELLMEIWYS